MSEEKGLPHRLRYGKGLLSSLRKVYGDDLAVVLKALMEPPKRYYLRVNTSKLDPGEVVDTLRSKGYEVYFDELVSEAIWLPVCGPYKLPSDVECKVYVDKFTAESAMLGAYVYVPGVVAAEECLRRGSEVLVVYSDVPVAYGIAEMDYEELRKRREGVAVRVVRSLYHVPSLREEELHRAGVLYEQSYPSMVATVLLDPQPGELVVDMCAAPGGKTSHIVERSRGLARVVAVDHSAKRISKMIRELSRLGHLMNPNLLIERADSRYLHVDFPFLQGKVDKVLLDPPCSAIGVVPKISDTKSVKDVLDLQEYQKQFLKAAYALLRPGGRLVYSVCTITREECEEVISWALDHLGFELEVLDFTYRACKGVPPCRECLRFHPHVQRLGGYFIAVLKKTR